MTRFQKLLLALVGVLVVVIAVGVGLILKGQADASAQADYERCLAIYGFTPEDPGTPDELLAAAEQCSD